MPLQSIIKICLKIAYLKFHSNFPGANELIEEPPETVHITHRDCILPWHPSERATGPRFNIKMPSYQYRKSHCGDKTVVRSSYLHNGISYSGKKSSLYWTRPQVSIGSFRALRRKLTLLLWDKAVNLFPASQHWIRKWLVACSAPNHYLNQCWVFVSCTLRNKLQWNFNQNTKPLNDEYASQNIVCEMAAILSSPGGGELNVGSFSRTHVGSEPARLWHRQTANPVEEILTVVLPEVKVPPRNTIYTELIYTFKPLT